MPNKTCTSLSSISLISVAEKRVWYVLLLLLPLGHSCDYRKSLNPVTHAQFETFVNSTGYITDAEKYGWSIVQINVYDYITVDSANWRRPDGVNAPVTKDLPVTQVSYNDAIAYCKWSGTSLPSYEEYWELVKKDTRLIVSENNRAISNVNKVNIVGNVWDITEPLNEDAVRLAGGSLFCSISTCHGTDKNRALYVDKETGNIHIGFSVIE